MANGFQGKEGQVMPNMSDEFVHQVSDRYIELFENITGQPFQKAATADILDRVEQNILNYLQSK